MTKKKLETCKNAEQNPTCPYITQITQSSTNIVDIKKDVIDTKRDIINVQRDVVGTTKQVNDVAADIGTIKKALVGDDLQGGLVEKVNRLNLMYKVLVFIGGACLVAFIGIVLKVVLNA